MQSNELKQSKPELTKDQMVPTMVPMDKVAVAIGSLEIELIVLRDKLEKAEQQIERLRVDLSEAKKSKTAED